MPTITKLFPSGAWEVADIRHGQRVRLVYYGTKRAALAAFRATFPLRPRKDV